MSEEPTSEERTTAGETRMSDSESRLDALEDQDADSPVSRALSATIEAAIKRAFRWRNWIVIGLILYALGSAYPLGVSYYHAVKHPLANQQQAEISQIHQLTSEVATAQAQLHSEIVTSCGQGNVFRAEQVQVWDHFVSILEGTSPSAQVKQSATAFEAFVATVYAPQNCAAKYPAIPAK